MYQEKARRWGANDAVRQAIKDGKFMSLEDMTVMELSGRMNTEMVQLFYAESASIVNYIIDELGQRGSSTSAGIAGRRPVRMGLLLRVRAVQGPRRAQQGVGGVSWKDKQEILLVGAQQTNKFKSSKS